jgi:hypothetical protein
MNTNGIKWVADFYSPGDVSDKIVTIGRGVRIRGTLMNIEQVMISGTSKKMLVVMADEIIDRSVKKSTAPSGSATSDVSGSPTVAAVSINAYKYIGKDVCWDGTVVDILSAAIPFRVLLSSSGYFWIADFYSTDNLDERLFDPGTAVCVSGKTMSIDTVMIAATSKKIVVIFGKEAGKDGTCCK